MTIRILSHEISTHRTSALVFILWWLCVLVFTFVTETGGISDYAVSFHVATAVLAGAVVAWWRYPVRDGLLLRWSPAPPALAGALVAIVIVSIIFIREAINAAATREWGVARVADLLVSWVVAAAILGSIGLLCGLTGAIAAGSLARHFKNRSAPRV